MILVIGPKFPMPEMDKDSRFPSVKSMAKAYRVFGSATKMIDSVMVTALHGSSFVKSEPEKNNSRSQDTTVNDEYNQLVDSCIRVIESRAIAP